jgi:hypothetical protein
MSEPNQEPTMEEILASIRRIISEDDAAPAAEGDEGAPEEEPVAAEAEVEAPVAAEPVAEEPEPLADLVVEADEEVLELTEKVEEPAAPEPEVETHGDLDIYAAEPEPEVAAAPAWRPAEEEPLLEQSAAQSAASAFGSLAQRIAMPAGGRTLEDVTRELLRPLLKAWLDEHLPGIVQAKVEEEVERIARGRVR